jgi:hypothetical protein
MLGEFKNCVVLSNSSLIVFSITLHKLISSLTFDNSRTNQFSALFLRLNVLVNTMQELDKLLEFALIQVLDQEAFLLLPRRIVRQMSEAPLHLLVFGTN